MNSQTELVEADIFLRCSDASHKSNCIKLRNSLLNNFNEVSKAKVIKTINGDVDYCVYGIAKINSEKKLLFEKALNDMPYAKNKMFLTKNTSNKKNKSIVQSVKVLYSI